LSQRTDAGGLVSFPAIFSHPRPTGISGEFTSAVLLGGYFISLVSLSRRAKPESGILPLPSSDRGSGRVMVVRRPMGAQLMAYCFLALVTCGKFDRTLRPVLFNFVGRLLSSTRPASERCCIPRRSRYSSPSLDPYRFATGRETNDVALPSLFRFNASGRRLRQNN